MTSYSFLRINHNSQHVGDSSPLRRIQFYFHHRGFKYLLQFRSKFLFSQRNSESPRDSKRLLYCFLSFTREVVIVKSELQAARKDKTKKKKKERLRLKKSASFSRTNPKWKRTFAELVKIRSVRWWRAFAVKVTRSISIAPSFSLSKKRQRKEKYSEKIYSSGPFVVLDIHRESNSLSPRLLPLDETRRERECERTWVKGSGKG